MRLAVALRGFRADHRQSSQQRIRMIYAMPPIAALDLFFVCHTPTDVPPRIWGFYSTAWIGATDALFPKSRIATDGAEKIITAQQKVNEAFRVAKAKGEEAKAPHNGTDTIENIICLCPNHHIKFDFGGFTILDDFELVGEPGKLKVNPNHKINKEYLMYHRNHFYEDR